MDSKKLYKLIHFTKDNIIRCVNAKFLFLVFLFFQLTVSFGWDFNMNYVQNLEIDKTNRILSFNLPVYNSGNPSGDNDNLWFLKLYIKNSLSGQNQRILGISGYGNNEFTGSGNIPYNSVFGYSDDENNFRLQNFLGFSSTMSVYQGSINPSSLKQVKISVTIPENYAFEDNYEFHLHIHFEDGGDNTDVSENYYRSGWPSLTNPNISTSTEDCKIKLSLTEKESWEFYQVKSKEVGEPNWSGWQNIGNSLEFIDNNFTNSISDPNNEKQYQVRIGYGPNLKDFILSDIVTGSIPEILDPPNDIEASIDQCNKEIEVSWNWSGPNPEQFRIDVLGETIFVEGNKRNHMLSMVNDLALNANMATVIFVSAVNECDEDGVSDQTTGKWIDDPETPTNFQVNEVTENGIRFMRVSWNDNAINEEKYVLKKSKVGIADEYIKLDLNETSYDDENVSICDEYTYTIYAQNNCTSFENGDGIAADSSISRILTFNLASTFGGNSNFDASKGYFPNRIEIDWNPQMNTNLVEGYKLYKKVLDSSSDYEFVESFESGDRKFIDELASAGIFYEYMLFGESECNGIQKYTDTVKTIGFRSPVAVVNGQIAYEGGVAVSDVKVLFETTTSSGKSIHVPATGYINIAQNFYNPNNNQKFYLETWVKPSSTNFDIFERENDFTFKYEGSKFVFIKNNVNHDFEYNLSLNNWTHFGLKYDGDSLHIFANGQKIGAKSYVSTVQGQSFSLNNVEFLHVGKNLDGYVDEIRFWNTAPADSLIQLNYSRHINGDETGLVTYLKVDEIGNNQVFDISFEGENYHKNDGELVGNITISTDKPTDAQLSHAAYTNENGSYTMFIPYSGVGQNFTITPSYGVHQFSPASTTLFMGDGANVNNGIDFEDISSFQVTGSVFYDSTTCPVEDVSIFIDGKVVVQNGELIKTNAQGEFDFRVPIGNHVVTINKDKHLFKNNGRYPSIPNSTKNFTEAISGLKFYDETLVTVIGRVTGGQREASKKQGFGKTKNNIGVAEIIFETTTGDGCFLDRIETDSTTGEFKAKLPPLNYTQSVKILTNSGVKFGVLDELDYTSIPDITSVYDTINNIKDSVVYHHVLNHDYYVIPEIVVLDIDGENPFGGDTTLIYSVGDNTDTLNLNTNPVKWPVFSKGNEDKEYQAVVRVFEKYVNKDQGLINDSVPTTLGQLEFKNELAAFSEINDSTVQFPKVEMKDINTVDSLKNLIYSFYVGAPNFLINQSIPQYSFTKTFEIIYTDENGSTVHWEPIPQDEVPQGGNRIYRGYVLGDVFKGNQFITNGPEIPEFVLRDPPGSHSFATREVGTSMTSTNAWSSTVANSTSATDKVFVGVDAEVGWWGYYTDIEIEAGLENGIETSESVSRSGEISTTQSLTQSWSTSTSNEYVGKESDIYIGSSQNIQFGMTEKLNLIPSFDTLNQNSVLGNDIRKGTSGIELSMTKANSLSIIPKGYNTTFIYSENHIKEVLIPNLTQLRNSFLIGSNAKYSTSFNSGDEHFGKNNDDQSLTNPSTTTRYIAEDADTTGESYTYFPHLSDSTEVDSVRYFNNQIIKWQDAIALNEWEKVVLGNEDSISVVVNRLKQKELKRLENKYEEVIIAYPLLAASFGVGYTAVKVSSITPQVGSTIAGSVAFGVTTGLGIAESEVYNEYNKYLAEKARIEQKFEAIEGENYSINGGVEFTSSVSQERITTTSTSIEFNMSASLSANLEVSVAGIGFEQTRSMSLDYSSSKDWSKENAENETVSFTISEDEGDYMSVDVYPSLLGWGPVFKRKPGGVSSCPYEGVVETEYFNPGTEISAASQQAHVPEVSVSPSILTNIPTGESAVFNLTLSNLSQDNSEQTYSIRVLKESNPFGAIVKIDGLDPNIDVNIPEGVQINKVLSVEKGPGSVYDYENIKIVLESPCEPEIGDTVEISAKFIPTCTEVNLIAPENQWIVNANNNDILEVVVGDYDVNHYGLDRFWIQYKPSTQAEWIGLESFWKDTIPADQELPIPLGTTYTPFQWNVENLTDGNFDLRVVSKCELVDDASPVYSGVIDRVNPHAFGTPSPADGIFSANDEISITFNEDINAGALSKNNFDIRGVLNGGQIRHQTSVAFNGTTSYIEIPQGVNLQSRNFTIEFWGKNNNFNDAVFLSQGSGSQEGLVIGTESTGKVYFDIGGVRVKTDGNVPSSTEWHHYAFVYNYANETVEIIIDGTLKNSNTNLPKDYVGSGKILIGKSLFGSPDYFEGNIHELRIWNHTRSISKIITNMNVQVGKQNIGLLHNWRMEEADGAEIVDHVRFKNAALKNTIWSLFPSGYALSLDSLHTSNFSIKSNNIAFTNESDFSLEFWFKGSNDSRETLFSNGKGDGIGPDSLTAWSLTKYTDGSLHLLHNGEDVEVIPTGSFDGNWHHFALVVNRTSDLSSYLDGNLKKTVSVSNYREFGGSKIVLGSRVYQTGLTTNYDEYFTGQLDEFRIWNLSRSQQQINRDLRFTMQGDEYGLIAYLPFENYVINTGVNILQIDLSDQVDTSHEYTMNANGMSYSGPAYDSSYVTENTPNIKLPRPVEKVNFTYSVNGDKIILTPTSPKAKIENVSLDITVKDVSDLHGNSMQSPATWIAYPDQNQIVWETDLVTIDILKDEGYSFTKKIVNSGGSATNFTIENIPTWLTSNVTQGLIEPGSTFEVTFTVVEDVNIGSYKEDIIVLTDFNYPERLTVDLKVRGEEPTWNVNPSTFEKSMSIIGNININDVISIDPDDILYVFVNDECRGKASLQYIASTDKFVAFLDVYSNSSAADSLEFKIWDASTGSIFVDVTPDDLTFVTDGLEGSLLSPQQFDAYSRVQENYSLVEGWNWVSFHLATSDTLNLTQLLSSLDHQDGDQIKTLGNNTFATYSETLGWIGNLTATGVNLAKGYKIKVSQIDTLVNFGDVVNPLDYPVHLQSGWSWIGFVSKRPMNINVALGNLNPTTGDLIKGQTNFSVYDDQLGWIGSLNTMFPGQSYMYNSLNTDSVTFI